MLSFALALMGGILSVWLLHRRGRNAMRKTSALIALSVLVITPLITGLANNPQPITTKTIAAVQGNANAGLFSNLQRGSILDNHLSASELIFDSELAGDIDLLVWPENASDLDTLRDEEAARKIDELAKRVGAPFSFGTITTRGGENFNTTLLWEPGVGAVDFYDKQQPVPFAEFVPDREFWRLLAPTLIDMVPEGFSFGTRDGIYEV